MKKVIYGAIAVITMSVSAFATDYAIREFGENDLSSLFLEDVASLAFGSQYEVYASDGLTFSRNANDCKEYMITPQGYGWKSGKRYDCNLHPDNTGSKSCLVETCEAQNGEEFHLL